MTAPTIAVDKPSAPDATPFLADDRPKDEQNSSWRTSLPIRTGAYVGNAIKRFAVWSDPVVAPLTSGMIMAIVPGMLLVNTAFSYIACDAKTVYAPPDYYNASFIAQSVLGLVAMLVEMVCNVFLPTYTNHYLNYLKAILIAMNAGALISHTAWTQFDPENCIGMVISSAIGASIFGLVRARYFTQDALPCKKQEDALKDEGFVNRSINVKDETTCIKIPKMVVNACVTAGTWIAFYTLFQIIEAVRTGKPDLPPSFDSLKLILGIAGFSLETFIQLAAYFKSPTLSFRSSQFRTFLTDGIYAQEGMTVMIAAFFKIGIYATSGLFAVSVILAFLAGLNSAMRCVDVHELKNKWLLASDGSSSDEEAGRSSPPKADVGPQESATPEEGSPTHTSPNHSPPRLSTDAARPIGIPLNPLSVDALTRGPGSFTLPSPSLATSSGTSLASTSPTP